LMLAGGPLRLGRCLIGAHTLGGRWKGGRVRGALTGNLPVRLTQDFNFVLGWYTGPDIDFTEFDGALDLVALGRKHRRRSWMRAILRDWRVVHQDVKRVEHSTLTDIVHLDDLGVSIMVSYRPTEAGRCTVKCMVVSSPISGDISALLQDIRAHLSNTVAALEKCQADITASGVM
jgi:hypothetical protein